jgi:hypothetical protein
MLYELLKALMRATCHAHLIILDFVTLIQFDEGNKLWSPSIRRLATSSLLGPNVFLSNLLSNILNLVSSNIVKDKVSHP